MAKKVIAFDLDDTLCVSKTPITRNIASLLNELLARYEVCIISGGRFEQFKSQVIDMLSQDKKTFKKLHMLPTCGTRYYRYEGDDWQLLYSEDIDPDYRKKVISVIEEKAKQHGLWREDTWGDIIEDRVSQVTYSALGQEAPATEKYKWAEDNHDKKLALKKTLSDTFPDLEVRLGGSTSIDITLPGIDKAYGIKKLMSETGVSKDEILFIGDRLMEGGNDYPVKELGVDTIAVEKWEDTALVIETIIKL